MGIPQYIYETLKINLHGSTYINKPRYDTFVCQHSFGVPLPNLHLHLRPWMTGRVGRMMTKMATLRN